jgi:hypothetical protein
VLARCFCCWCGAGAGRDLSATWAHWCRPTLHRAHSNACISAGGAHRESRDEMIQKSGKSSYLHPLRGETNTVHYTLGTSTGTANGCCNVDMSLFLSST